MSSQLTPLEVPGTAPAVPSGALLLPATSGFAPATGPATSAVMAVPAATTNVRLRRMGNRLRMRA